MSLVGAWVAQRLDATVECVRGREEALRVQADQLDDAATLCLRLTAEVAEVTGMAKELLAWATDAAQREGEETRVEAREDEAREREGREREREREVEREREEREGRRVESEGGSEGEKRKRKRGEGGGGGEVVEEGLLKGKRCRFVVGSWASNLVVQGGLVVGSRVEVPFPLP